MAETSAWDPSPRALKWPTHPSACPIGHTPWITSDPQMLSRGLLLNLLCTCCLWMLILPKLQVLWFFIILSISESFACFLRLAFLVGDKIMCQQIIHDTHNLCIFLGLRKATEKSAIEAHNSLPRQIAIRRVQVCNALPVKRGKV